MPDDLSIFKKVRVVEIATDFEAVTVEDEDGQVVSAATLHPKARASRIADSAASFAARRHCRWHAHAR